MGELALVGRGQRGADSLTRAIVHENRTVREYAAHFAGQISSERTKKPSRLARQVVRLALSDEDPMVRVEGLRSAVYLEFLQVKSGIESKLVDEVREVRVEAAGALLALERLSR